MPRVLSADAWLSTLSGKFFNREPWVADAACSGHPEHEIFFSEKETCKANYQRAKLICSGCPVWKDCLDYSMRNYEQFGIWGGLTIKERTSLRRGGKARICSHCRLIRVFMKKAQDTCEKCSGTSSRGRSRRG